MLVINRKIDLDVFSQIESLNEEMFLLQNSSYFSPSDQLS